MHSSKISTRRQPDVAAGPPAASPLHMLREGSGNSANVRLARFKIDFVNRFIRANAVPNLVEFGCGGGRVMRRLRVAAYIGVESSEAAVLVARGVAGDDRSRVIYRALPAGMGAAMALSMDSINRLTGDAEFNVYVRTMFQAAREYVVIYAADRAAAWADTSIHERLTVHVRRFFPGWELVAQLPSPHAAAGQADFFIYARCGSACVVPLMALL
jgi:SAM-dependent methyltransferase